jgi:serine/threonine-protein kinase
MRRSSEAGRLLRAHLAAGAPAREAVTARFFILLTTLALGAVLVLTPTEGRATFIGHLPAFAPFIAYHGALLVLLRRGWFHPVLPWLDAAVQTSLLAVPFYLVTRGHAANPIAGATMPVAWMVPVALSALKVNPLISLAAGVLAATEYVALAVTAGGDAPAAPGRPQMMIIGVFLVLSGALAAGIATYLIRETEAALRAVREQDLFGKYLMHERLGAGGMAEVFRATYSPEGGFEKTVAVKRVLPQIAATGDGQRFLAMFREEARLGSQLSHPNVVQVLDAGKFRESYVVAMEYVDGLPLHRVLRDAGRAIPMPAIVFVAAELAAALDYIHARVDAGGQSLGLVHRDVNPPNVLVSKLGEVKLADFGVAHAVSRASLDPDRVYGKLGYLAPEQLHDTAIDGRADLFGLGVTVFEMIAGKPLFRGKSLTEVEEIRMPEAELDALPRGPEIPHELRALVCDLLAIRPEARPATGAIVRARLLAIVGSAAAFPDGQRELAAMVNEALRRPVSALPAPTAATAATVPLGP